MAEASGFSPRILAVQAWGDWGSRVLMIWPDGQICSVEKQECVLEVMLDLMDKGFAWGDYPDPARRRHYPK